MEKKEKEVIYKNPFPVTAVANFYNSLQNNLIVDTEIIKKTKKIVDDWILQENEGVTIAVQGEYGTGKTQLAVELYKHIMQRDENRYHFICLDSPSISFLEMYKNRFLNEVNKEDILKKLEEYYVQIILEDLKKNELYAEGFSGVIKKFGMYELIEQFGLPKSKYDRIFDTNLVKVTRNKRFVPALHLLMLPQFEQDVWNWFCGMSPTEALRERGIDFCINDDSIALEAIGVFAFLFGQQGHRFVLFIDEMEKITSNTECTIDKNFDSLKKLFETIKETRTMLLLCGLPDYYESFPRDVKQRIGYEIQTTKLSIEEIKTYIINANKDVNEKETLEPFSEKMLETILDISNGNIRTIIRLLYHSCKWYLENEMVLDENNLSRIVDNAYGKFEISNILSSLRQLIISKGWLFEEKKGVNGKIIIDFWIPSVCTPSNKVKKGVEIYVVKNLISNEEYEELSKKLNNEKLNCKVLIVEGFISEEFRTVVLQKIQYIIRYKENNFKELFISVIDGERIKWENELNRDNLLVTNEKIEQLSRIVNRAIIDINENFIGKQEFHYLLRKISNNEKEQFYVLPNKDSEFYLSIYEIEKIIENKSIYNNKRNEYEIGLLYFIRELNYIIYYIAEVPQKVNVFYRNLYINEICYILREVVHNAIRTELGNSYKFLRKYQLLIEYLCQTFEENSVRKGIKEEESWIKPYHGKIYEEDIFDLSVEFKQMSQFFCTNILMYEPDVFMQYINVFGKIYYFLYEIEPAILRRDIVNYDLEILLEYYDLIRRFLDEKKEFISKETLSQIFSKYDRGLRRVMHDNEE